MKNVLKSCLVLLSAAFITGCATCPKVSDLPLHVQAKWCSLGTSITWYNSHVNKAVFQEGYQTRVLKELQFAEFSNKGVNGGCIRSAIDAVEPADIYTIEHGINDWGHAVKVGTMDDYLKDTGTGTFYGGYRKVIDKIRATSPDAPIVLCTPRKAYGFGSYLPAKSSDPKQGIYLKEYAQAVQEIAKHEGFEVADFYSNCGEQEELKSLSIDVALHPNDKGYQRMADELIPAMLRAMYKAKIPMNK